METHPQIGRLKATCIALGMQLAAVVLLVHSIVDGRWPVICVSIAASVFTSFTAGMLWCRYGLRR